MDRPTRPRGAWQMLDGPAEDHQLGETRAKILRWLRQAPSSTPKAIAEATGLKPETVRQTCRRMIADGQLSADTAGRYRVPGVTAVTTVTADASTGAADEETEALELWQ